MPWYSPSAQSTIEPEKTYASIHAKPSNVLVKTSQVPKISCILHLTSQMEYHLFNGTTFSEESPLTSIKFSHQCTLYNLMTRERAAWETLKSCLQLQNLNDKSKQELNGQQCFVNCQQQSPSFFYTKEMNSENMLSTLKASLW